MPCSSGTRKFNCVSLIERIAAGAPSSITWAPVRCVPEMLAIIHPGAEDRLTPVKYSQYLHEHIAGSTLRIVQNAGHYVMREQPQAVNQAIEDFLASRLDNL